MDDQQKIHLIRNEGNLHFVCAKALDFRFHEQLKEISDLRDNDWSHVHITQNTLSFGNNTYNLKTKISIQMNIPKYFFG